MSNVVNVYCDESAHLEHDGIKAMALGAVWCSHDVRGALSRHVQGLKIKHGLAHDFEIKWTKVSPGKTQFYLELVDYFFDTSALHFRGVVIPNKEILDHAKFGQTHDDFYYKMWFLLLSRLLSPDERYRIYIDIKDTKGANKTQKLHEILSTSKLDFKREIVEWIQTVRSHDVPLLQLADLLTGSLAYFHRGLQGNAAKKALVDRIRERTGHGLLRSTLLREQKFNVFVWAGQVLT
jgi:hypothetical protein